MTAIHAMPVFANVKNDALVVDATNGFDLKESNSVLRAISLKRSQQSRDGAGFGSFSGRDVAAFDPIRRQPPIVTRSRSEVGVRYLSALEPALLAVAGDMI